MKNFKATAASGEKMEFETEFNARQWLMEQHVKSLTDDQLVLLAESEREARFPNSDAVVIEFERRMIAHGCNADRVDAAQIDYIRPGETLKQFADRLETELG